MEYDFSKIDTDELRKSIDLYSGMEDIACDVITSYSIHYTKLYEELQSINQNLFMLRLNQRGKNQLKEATVL